MLLDPSTIAFMYVCPRSMLSPVLPFSLLFLLPGYNGQTHNKEGKTRDCGTRYVGRLTMEHTWARAGAFEVALGRQKVPHGAPVWNVEGEGGGREKNAGERGERRKERNNAFSLFCLFFFFFSSTAADAARVPSSIPLGCQHDALRFVRETPNTAGHLVRMLS